PGQGDLAEAEQAEHDAPRVALLPVQLQAAAGVLAGRVDVAGTQGEPGEVAVRDGHAEHDAVRLADGQAVGVEAARGVVVAGRERGDAQRVARLCRGVRITGRPGVPEALLRQRIPGLVVVL